MLNVHIRILIFIPGFFFLHLDPFKNIGVTSYIFLFLHIKVAFLLRIDNVFDIAKGELNEDFYNYI